MAKITVYENFTRDDLKMGYVVELRNGEFRMVMPVGNNGTLILCGAPNDPWNYLSCWDDNLEARSQRFVAGPWPSFEAQVYARQFDIMKVYGLVQGSVFYNLAGELSADNRDVLWSRINPKKMTLKEIEKKLGYPVEIVSDDED